MVKCVLSLVLKITLFAAIMLMVAKTLNYDDLVGSFVSQHVSFEDADKIGRMVSGEPDPEPTESIRFYISILINTLISVPILSAIFTAYKGVTHKLSPASLHKEWAFSSLRRFAKIFVFTFLFWALFRFLPYQLVFSGNQTYSAFAMAAIVGFILLITIFCYWVITKKIIIKRSL